jgi:5'/3'-nucleotidase
MTEKQERPLILITNDDGLDSPGLAAAAHALEPLGELLIIAPRTQQTGVGRSGSQQGENDGHLFKREIHFGGQTWPAYAVNATPAMAVEHAFYQLAQRPIALAVSGINFGENVGSLVTSSGTVGAALEAADHGIPALAASLELNHNAYFEHDHSVDFTAAAHFVQLFAARLLQAALPPDVDMLKIEVPASATLETDWMVTHQDRIKYFAPLTGRLPDPFAGPNLFDYRPQKGQYLTEGSDAFALARGLVSVTPLSLNLTSRTDLAGLSRLLEPAGKLVA